MSISRYSVIDEDGNVVIDPSFEDVEQVIALQNLRRLDTVWKTMA